MRTFIRLPPSTLREHPWGVQVRRVLEASLSAVDPEQAVIAHLKVDGSRLVLDGTHLNLDSIERIFLVGAGKAGVPMAEAVQKLLGNRLTRGMVVVKDGYAQTTAVSPHIPIFTAAHPIPDQRGIMAAKEIFNLLQNTTPHDLVIFLISGGGSALMTSPPPGISLLDLQKLTEILLKCGATINEINVLRKHLDEIKGGQLARKAAPARIITLILSDVVGDPLDIIASGPTVPDPSTFQDALAILERHSIVPQVPTAILDHLRQGADGNLPDTPKPGDPLFERVTNIVIASNKTAAQAAVQQAQREGFHAQLLTSFLQGEARQAGRFLAAVLKQMAIDGQPLMRPACLVAGGETTVTLKGEGLGGRNQELALAAVNDLADLPGALLAALATDGGDGPTDAAGAVVSEMTHERALKLGLDPQLYLSRNDSYHFFKRLDDLIITGPTQTNVNDLIFLFTFPLY